MAVNSSTNRVDAVGTGAQTAFPYSFNVYTTGDLDVYVDGVLKTINTDYTQSAVNVPGGLTGGTVTFTSAPANGAKVLLLRTLAYTQGTSFTNLDKFDAKSAIEGTFDKGVMQTQQVVEQLGRSVQVPVTSSLTSVLMPDPALPANYGLGLKIKGDGTGIDSFVLNQGQIVGLVTTKGDILIFGAGVPDRLGVGANDSILIADSTQAKGLKWSASPANLTLVNATLSGTLTGLINAVTGQIQFPGSQNPSANVNTLDDYEEGVWTPNVGGNTTYSVQSGTYTKIGRLVFIWAQMSVTTLGTGSASTISGLPFTSGPTFNNMMQINWSSAAASYVQLVGVIGTNATTMTFSGATAAAASLTAQSPIGNGAVIILSGCYQTAT